MRRIGPGIRRIQGFLSARGFPLTKNDRRLAALKDIHSGGECFVIGNGPSLRVDDLGRLGGRITFASNQVFIAFRETDWRPTYYTVVDPLIGKRYAEQINAVDATRLLPLELKGVVESGERTIFYYPDFRGGGGGKPWPRFSVDASERVFGGASVTYVNLQLAFHVGIETVYLIGVDHNYPSMEGGENGSRPGEIADYKGARDHFLPGYFRPGERYIVPDFKKQEMGYEKAREVYEQHGRRIYNATRGGKLEVFPRVDLDEMLDGRREQT